MPPVDRDEIQPLNWHLGKIFLKINDERHYLWRAVDHEGKVLESFVTKTGNKAAALIMRSLQKFAAVHASVSHHFIQGCSLSSRPNFKPNRAAALAEWRQLGAA